MKNIYNVRQIIVSVIVFLLLIWAFFKNQLIGKIIIIPFLICSVAIFGEKLFLILNKKKISNVFKSIFRIVFFLYWFGFLIFFDYICLRDNSYIFLLFSLLFWFVGFKVAYNSLINKKKSIELKNKNTVNYKIMIFAVMIASTFIGGLIMLFIGFKNTYKLNRITKNYLSTDGYFTNYKNIDDDSTYKLIYTYIVDDIEYTISTDYGTNYIPKYNSIRKVKYDQNNPNEAVLVGTNKNIVLILVGYIFTLGSFIFILGILYVLGYLDRFKIDVFSFDIGIIFLMLGIGLILFQYGTTLSVIETINSLKLWLLIPLLFIIIGIYQIVISFKRKK